MARVVVKESKDLVQGFVCTLTLIVDDVTHEVTDVEGANTYPFSFTASVTDPRNGSTFTRTIPANQTVTLPAAQATALQNRHVIWVVGHSANQALQPSDLQRRVVFDLVANE